MEIVYSMPKKFQKVFLESDYKKNTKYSVTQLLKSPRQVALEKRYYDKVEFKPEEKMWSFFGSAFHDKMETDFFRNDDKSIMEERLRYKNVSGKFDHYDAETRTLFDFKFTSFWKAVYATEESMEEYQIQLSIYAWMLEKIGFEVEKIANLLIFRDWKKSDATKVPLQYATVYHDKLEEIANLSIPNWIDKRVEIFEKSEKMEDDELPFCTEKERWAQPDKFAVVKNRNKRATKLFDSEFGAKNFIMSLEISDPKNKYKIEKRIGEKFKRCEYCPIHNFCNQYKGGKA